MIAAPVFCPRFIGRQSELAELIDRRRNLAKSRGGLVLVSGDAGIGKTRLIGEFLEQTGGSRSRAAVGRCRAFGCAPYEPLLELLAVLAPAASKLIPAQTQSGQYTAIAGAFSALAAQHAVVAVVEDIHWADTGSIAVLGVLAERLVTSRILLVATYRANELGPDHTHYIALGAMLRNRCVLDLQLAPLSSRDAHIFIDDTLQHASAQIPSPVRRRVERIAEGNPFFIEELLKSAVDGERNANTGDALPRTVQAAILERLQPLNDDERAMLSQAAVIGRRFEADVLAVILGRALRDVLLVLGRACSLQIVEETEAGTAFRFRHALTREAIYDRLLTAARQPLHRQIALALESRSDERPSTDALAYHWWAAGDRSKALEYGERGGDAAQAVHAYAHSIEAYERVLSLLDSPGADAARIRAKIGTSAFRAGMMERAVVELKAAWTFVRTTAKAPAMLVLACTLAAALYNDGRTDESRDYLREAVDAIVRCGDPRSSAAARLRLAAYLVDTADAGEVAALLQTADAEGIADEPRLAISFWQTSARRSALTADIPGIHRAGDALTSIANRGEADYALIEGLAEVGIAAVDLGEAPLARRCFRRASQISLALNSPASHGDVLVESALERVLSGAFSEAGTLIKHALNLIGEGTLGRHRAVLAALCVGFASDDRELLALEPASESLDAAFETRLPIVYGPLAAICAQLLAAREQPSDARRLLRRALTAVLSSRQTFGSFPLVIVAAQHAGANAAGDVRKLAALGRCGGPAAACAADLAEAILERRFGPTDDTASCALAQAAADGFAAIGRPLYEALALEIAGDVTRAQTIFARIRYQPKSAVCLGRSHGASTPNLTPREFEVATLVSRGLSNRQIAAALDVSIKLVEKSCSSIYAKRSVTSRAQLIAQMLVKKRDQGFS